MMEMISELNNLSESRIVPVQVRSLTLGDSVPKICVPVVASDPEQLEKALTRLEGTRDFYDLVELRADICPFDGTRELSESLRRLRKAVGDKPILFTFRTKEEGGNREVSFDSYREMNLCAAQEGADLVDLQLSMMEGDRMSLLSDIHGRGARVIGSFHDFHGTPPADELVKKMAGMQMAGFDITKIAVMPKDREDVLELLFASVQMQEEWADRPFITMSMGSLGSMTRVCGTFSGICTWAAEGGGAEDRSAFASIRKMRSESCLLKEPRENVSHLTTERGQQGKRATLRRVCRPFFFMPERLYFANTRPFPYTFT